MQLLSCANLFENIFPYFVKNILAVSLKFKNSLIALLQSYIDEQKPLIMEWQCSFCQKNHAGNLFKKVIALENNKVSGELKADIGLMTVDGNLFAAIHISKNKKPTESADIQYRKQGVIYIQIAPNEDHLASIQKPFYVGACLNPKCKTCGSFQYDKSLVIVQSKCWKCSGDMKVAVLDCGGGHYPGPDDFTEAELNIARQNGAVIQSNYSKTAHKSYLSNTCPNCQAMTGDHYLFTDHFTEAMYGYYKYERIPVGYFCENCYWNK